MPGVEYQHIGHDPRRGPIALWAVDERGALVEARRHFVRPDADFLDFSHEAQFREVKHCAVGRVELATRSGTVHISDPALARSTHKLARLYVTLSRSYPNTRWFVFGNGYQGEPLTRVLADAERLTEPKVGPAPGALRGVA